MSEINSDQLHKKVHEAAVTLTELPETPKGWTKHLVIHLNYGEKGGAATYSINDEQGRKTNIGYAYDTRKSRVR